MNSKCVRTGLFQTNCYIVEDNSAAEPFCAVIDPGDDLELILAGLANRIPTHIIVTHAHFDHVGALKALHDLFPTALVAAGEHEPMDPETISAEARYVLGSSFFMAGFNRDGFDIPSPSLLLKDGDTIGPFRVLFTPGHSFGSICLYSEKDKLMFSGDTLFRGDYGRTDINGSEELILKSLRRLLSMEDDIKVFPGHDGSTTIGDEKRHLAYLLK